MRVALALDCHDREAIGWTATTAGLSGEMIDLDLLVRRAHVSASLAAGFKLARSRSRIDHPDVLHAFALDEDGAACCMSTPISRLSPATVW